MRDTRRLKFVKLKGFPIGSLLSRRSFVAKDPLTTQGIAQFQDHMQNKQTGVLLLFAHLGIIDVFGTPIALEKYFDFKAVFPVAASWFYFPILKDIFQSIQNQVRHEYYPVYRKEEMGYGPDDMEVLDFSGTTQSEKKQANKAYLQAALRRLKSSQGMVIAAPYGGRAPQEHYLRFGITKLVSKDVPIMFSLTKWSWRTLSYEIYFSQLHSILQPESNTEFHNLIFSEFFRMAQLAGVSKEELVSAKETNTLVRKMWNNSARLLKKLFPRLR